MSAQANKVRIGAFVIGALALALLAVAVIGSGRLFSTQLRVVMFFESSLRGLSAGSPVVFRGVPVGRVSTIHMSGNVDTKEILIPVYVELDTSVMKDLKSSAPASSPQAAVSPMHKLAQQGLRARLNNQSLLTGLLLIELDFFPATRHDAFIPMSAYDGLPVIPTVPSPVEADW
jgi:paraquat-inducible protein B